MGGKQSKFDIFFTVGSINSSLTHFVKAETYHVGEERITFRSGGRVVADFPAAGFFVIIEEEK